MGSAIPRGFLRMGLGTFSLKCGLWGGGTELQGGSYVFLLCYIVLGLPRVVGFKGTSLYGRENFFLFIFCFRSRPLGSTGICIRQLGVYG